LARKIIKIVPADFLKAVEALQKIQNELESYQTELSNNYGMLRNDWQGEAGAAFEDCAQKLLKSFESNIANLSQLATDIEEAGKFMEDMDRQIAQAIATA
jgi:WXG100 family type VII secretion target